MSSSSSETSSFGKVPLLICSICMEVLVSDFTKESKIVHTICGHVFHETCLQDSYRADNTGKRVWNRFRCPYCRCRTRKDCSKTLFLQTQLDHDARALIEENRNLSNKNADLKKKINVSEIRLMLLQPDNEILARKLCALTWKDVTKEFQTELLQNIKSRFGGLNIHNLTDFSFLRSPTLLQIIKSEPNERLLLLNIIMDYFDEASTLNDHHTWEHFKHLFKNDMASRIRNACNVPSLDLSQIPMNLSILKTMAIHEHQFRAGHFDKSILADIAESYLEGFLNFHINELFKLRLTQLVSAQLNSEITLYVHTVNHNILKFLQRKGVLKKVNGKFEFTHDLIKSYITGIMICLILQNLKMNLKNARQYFFRRYDANDSLDECFVHYMSKSNINQNMDAYRYASYFDSTDADNLRLLAIMAVMNLSNTNELTRTLQTIQLFFHKIGKNVWEMEYPCIVGSVGSVDTTGSVSVCMKYLSLPNFAAIRGNVSIMEELYSLFTLEEYPNVFDFQELIHLSSSWTIGSSDEDIRERKKLLALLLLYKNDHVTVNKFKPKNTPQTVHVSLIRYIMEHDCFKEIWSVEAMVYECTHFLDPINACDLISCASNPIEWKKIVDIYCSTWPRQN